jgi:hypothetical protein
VTVADVVAVAGAERAVAVVDGRGVVATLVALVATVPVVARTLVARTLGALVARTLGFDVAGVAALDVHAMTAHNGTQDASSIRRMCSWSRTELANRR